MEWGVRCACISWKADLMWFGWFGGGFVEVWDGLVEVWGGLVEFWVVWGVSMDRPLNTVLFVIFGVSNIFV